MTFLPRIEKGIVCPPARPYNKYPFRQMEVGDSFFYRGGENTIRTAASRAGSRQNKKFTIRQVKDGYRVWRIK